jgi:hypothetical protein
MDPRGTIRHWLTYLLEVEHAAAESVGKVSPTKWNSADRHSTTPVRPTTMDVALSFAAAQQLLGNWHVGATMRLVKDVADTHRNA